MNQQLSTRGLTEAQQQLIESHHWLVNRLRRRLARRAALLPLDLSEQIHNVTADALMEAARTYDRQRGPFTAWVARIVDLRWRSATRREWRRVNAHMNGWSLMAWFRRPQELPNEQSDERALLVDQLTNAATAHMLGTLSTYSYDSALQQDQAVQLRLLHQRVEALLVEMRTQLSNSHEQVIRLMDLQPTEHSWVHVAKQMGIDKRTARARRVEALTWLSKRLKDG